jgi:phosphoglycolate phosphatase-like HAD superfamily hydrolase
MMQTLTWTSAWNRGGETEGSAERVRLQWRELVFSRPRATSTSRQEPMPTAIFDIDGTLTDTNAVDHECYVAAVSDVIGEEVGDDWGGVDDVTDSNVLREVWARRHAGTLPRDVEQAVIGRFLDLLGREARGRPERFHPIAGAVNVFARTAELGWAPAMATGGWRPSAQLKLRTASIPFGDVPLASASDHLRRVDIIRHALTLSADRSRHPAAVYFGDRPWDLRAARALGMAFVGVGVGLAADQLREAGASEVIADLTDTALLERLLRAAHERAP